MEVSFKVNGKNVATFPMFVGRHENSYLMRIKAIEYDTQRATIYPIYKQLFDAVKKPGEFVFSLFVGGKVYDLMLYARPPFINLGWGPAVVEVAGDEK